MVFVGASHPRLIVDGERQLANCFVFVRDLVYILEDTPPLIAMCDKTTERFKRPSFSVIIKWKRRTPKLCNQKTKPHRIPWHLGPRSQSFWDREASCICCGCRRRGDSLSSHWQRFFHQQLEGCVVSLTPNPGILLHSTEREREGGRERERMSIRHF